MPLISQLYTQAAQCLASRANWSSASQTHLKANICRHLCHDSNSCQVCVLHGELCVQTWCVFCRESVSCVTRWKNTTKIKKALFILYYCLIGPRQNVTNDIPYDKILFILFVNTHTHTVFVLHWSVCLLFHTLSWISWSIRLSPFTF